APRGEGTILLVEDESALRVLAAESLRKLGYTVIAASNGIEALAAADQSAAKIDIVITDIVMPAMGGPELVKKLREAKKEFAVIFMSGYTDPAVLENPKIGADAILLKKPFSTEAFARSISEAQRRSRDTQPQSMAATTA